MSKARKLRKVAAMVVAALSLSLVGAAAAADWKPSQPIEFVVTAGPGGGTPDKPVGLVHLAAARRDAPVAHERLLFGDVGRNEIRRESVVQALALLASLLRGE